MMDVVTGIKVVQMVIGVLGMMGNAVVCLVIVRVPAMRTLTNAFIFNQAVIDLLGSLFMVLHGSIATPVPLHPNQVVAAVQCYLWFSSILLWILFVASTFNLVTLTLERYVAIVFPFHYLAHSGRRQATATLAAVWGLAVAYKSTNVIYFKIQDRVCGINDGMPPTLYLGFGILTFLVEYLVPLVVMTFCYGHIILTLKKASAVVHHHPEPAAGDPGARGQHDMGRSLLRARRNTLKTLFIVFVSYVVCWSPNEILFFLYNLGFAVNVEDGAFYYVSLVCVQSNSVVNPLIYSFKYRQFQRSLGVLLRPCCPRLAAWLAETAGPAATTAGHQTTAPASRVNPNVDPEASITVQPEP